MAVLIMLSQAFVQADKTKHNLKSYRLRQARYEPVFDCLVLKNMALSLNSTWVLSVTNDEEPDDKVLGLGVQIGTR